jgi:hypothetical protein
MEFLLSYFWNSSTKTEWCLAVHLLLLYSIKAYGCKIFLVMKRQKFYIFPFAQKALPFFGEAYKNAPARAGA